jgi:uncharacterized protein involved in exopolysaccharide biosynthesis
VTVVSLPRRILDRVVRGGGAGGRSRRYVIAGIAGTALIWALALAYLVLTPKSYTSSFTFVLPGTGAGSSVNLDNLGQASSTTTSAFATPDVSPTENYRKIMLSHRVLWAAANLLDAPESSLPKPKIELAEQTKLIIVSMTARTPEAARQRAMAMQNGFLTTLDALRADELVTRDAASNSVIDGYRRALDEARQRLIAHQVKTGLVSIDQYNGIVTSVEHLREQMQDVEVRLAQARSGVEELTHILGVTPDAANLAMVLRADPLFQTGLDQMAKDDTEIAGLTGTRGDANAHLKDLRAERSSIEARLMSRSAELTGKRQTEILKSPDLSLRDERARLFERLVGQVADQGALEGMRAQLDTQIAETQQRVVALAQDASHLDDLKRDVQVADTVFSSGLARVGTGKADFFASYPLVQTLEEPGLPDRPSSPMKLLALAGAAGATIFLTLALVMTWLRTHLLQKLLKSESSTRHSSAVGVGMRWAPST